jgi:predicted heme/steroid binding protein
MEGSEKKFAFEELKQYDGRNGRPAYIAYKGKVYDVTDDLIWIEGDYCMTFLVVREPLITMTY